MYQLLEGLQNLETISDYTASHSLREIVAECAGEKKTEWAEAYTERGFLNLADLKENLAKYRWLYERLWDHKSCQALTAVCRYYLCEDPSVISPCVGQRPASREELWADVPAFPSGAVRAGRLDEVIACCQEKLSFTFRLEAPEDLWEIPELIESVCEDYRLSLRCYGTQHSFETLLYAAAPAGRELRKKPGVFIWPIPGEVCWQNEQLMKDCVVIPYLYYRKYGDFIRVPSRKVGEYPYLDRMPGLRMDYLEFPKERDAGEDVRVLCGYIRQHAAEMDMVFLYGAYGWFMEPLELYRSLRPDGRVVLKLDMNSGWMDYLPADTADFCRFLARVDLIAVESHYLQKLLTKKWRRKIEYITNGAYGFGKKLPSCPAYEEKRNVILTVGRLGTRQKNNEVLLEAFALAAKELPGWQVRLVGGIDEGFLAYKEQYFIRHPELEGRVVFTGKIVDKELLFQEYDRAKIFALTSVAEGFPNVFAEAAFHGCYFITSEVDAAQDMTDEGRCGRSFPIGDADALAEILWEVCRDEPLLKQGCRAVWQYAQDYFDYEKIVERLHMQLEADDGDEEAGA